MADPLISKRFSQLRAFALVRCTARPVLGGLAAGSVGRGASSARASSADVRSSTRLLAGLAGQAVAILPAVPVLLITSALRRY